eukprot:1386646-Prymnesium_polylepis.1
MASPPLWRRLPAGCACWRPRRSLGASEGAWPRPEPLPHHLARTAHHPAGSLPDRDGGTAFCPAA